ncbi:2-methylaconitate cis-trans isomerase PrpF family protein [Anaerotruncus colihominis]|nr:PrpF domain-containing protein [Anaerotruncus colihominis]MCR2025645.1 3-methylitaconate isomerase [Anaerotruncus colihominis]
MSDQMRIPCVIMRAGTSKGIFIKENDLPKNQAMRDKTILAIFGSPDVRQIDGLAGADPLTSKLAIIGPPTRDDADVDYTFGQVSIDGTVIDYSGNCGNISSGVGPFAIDESMVRAEEGITMVRIHNTNTGKILRAEVEVRDGKAVVSGNCKIDGVPGTSAPILMDFASTAGAATGKLLPTGNVVDVIETSKGAIEASMVDVANPCIFVRASDVGMKGTETPSEINGNKALLELLEELRAKGAVMMGKCKTEEEAHTKSPAFPMICFVTAPADYTDFTTGNTIKADEVDFVARLMFMQVLHKTYAGTATACTGAAAKIPGTIVNQVIPDIEHKTRIRIGHPAGVLPVVADVKDGHVEKAAFERTARRIMEGYVYVETSKVCGK